MSHRCEKSKSKKSMEKSNKRAGAATAPVVQLSLSAFSFTTTFAVLQVLLMATTYVR